MATLAAADRGRYGRGYRAWLLFLLLMLNVFNLADRQGVAAIAPAVKADLHLSDTQLGFILGLGFAIFYTVFGMPIAWLAERRSRVRIVSAALALFAVFVGIAGAARTFWQFMLCRIGVGVGDAGFGPPSTSIISDHYPASQRTAAITIVWLGAPIGAVSGAMIGGWVAQNSDWRLWCVGLAIPALLFALLTVLTLREPRRGMSDAVAIAGAAPPMMAAVRFLLSKPSMRHVMIGGALAATGMNGLGQFWARYFVSAYGIGTAETGRFLGMMSSVGMTSGLALGGFGIAWAARRDDRWFAWGPGLSLLLVTPLLLFAFHQPTVVKALPILIAAHVAIFVYYTPTLALTANMVGADMRASSAFLVGGLVLGLIGIGIGPTITGILSDYFAARAFAGGDFGSLCMGGVPAPGSPAGLGDACRAASAAGISNAVAVMALLFAWAGVHYLLAARSLRTDLARHYGGSGQRLS